MTKLSKSKIKEMAKNLAELNTMYWNVIGFSEEFISDIKDLDKDEKKYVIKEIAKEYKNVDKYDDEFIDVELYSAVMDDYNYIKDKIGRELDELEGEYKNDKI